MPSREETMETIEALESGPLANEAGTKAFIAAMKADIGMAGGAKKRAAPKKKAAAKKPAAKKPAAKKAPAKKK
jgi:hypothetical protein